MPSTVLGLIRIHRGVAIIPVHASNILVLDVNPGHQLHALPSAGEEVNGVCVFDGLTNHVICFGWGFFHTLFFYLSAVSEGGLEGE